MEGGSCCGSREPRKQILDVFDKLTCHESAIVDPGVTSCALNSVSEQYVHGLTLSPGVSVPCAKRRSVRQMAPCGLRAGHIGQDGMGRGVASPLST